jgi:hypothetical protein
MKRRLKSFEMFKESYLGLTTEFEDETMAMSEEGSEEAPVEGSEEAPVEGEEFGSEEELSMDDEFASEEGSEEEGSEEKDNLKEKVKTAIEANYSEQLSDIIKGITNELEGSEDQAMLIDVILDVLEEQVEQILSGGDEDFEEGEDLSLDDEESTEEVPLEDEEGSEEETELAPEMTEGGEEEIPAV